MEISIKEIDEIINNAKRIAVFNTIDVLKGYLSKEGKDEALFMLNIIVENEVEWKKLWKQN